MMSTSWYFITSLSSEKGLNEVKMENNNPKWTLTEMEKYMRDHTESTALGLLTDHPTTKIARKPQMSVQDDHNTKRPNGDASESAGEESSPSWASSSTGNTPSYGSGGMRFEFCSRPEDIPGTSTPPTITTTSCTPGSTPENSSSRKISEGALSICLSSDLLDALDSDLELYTEVKKNENSSGDRLKATEDFTVIRSQGGTPTRLRTLSRLLRRTQSAGSSKDTLFIKMPVTKTKSADSAACDREDGDEKDKRKRKSLAQDMKRRLSFLSRRHTDSSIESSVRPSQKEAQKWAESFQELTNSKYGLCLFRAFLAREFSEENIEFWLACEEYKRTKTDKLHSKAHKIYEDFVAIQSPKQVNLDSTIRSTIQNNLKKPDRHCFDSGQRRIQGLMEQDAFVRFLQSDLYTDLVS